MTIGTCPSPAELERLFLGGGPHGEAEALETHVLRCAACVETLQNLARAKDTLSPLLSGTTEGDAYASEPAVADLVRKLKSVRPASTRPLPQGSPMISITCSSCQKKLSVKEEAKGKKVKCPGCGKRIMVPALVPVGSDGRTVAPMPRREAATLAPTEAYAGEKPTHPLLEKPDATLGVKPIDSEHDASLTDFLAPAQAPDELGRLGNYRILKILGHGGMGVVYKAEDLKLKRAVAVKAMLPALAASASCGARFKREAEAMAAVEHDHIVRIYEINEDRGVPFLAMEFLRGEPLDERLRRESRLPIADVLRFGREIAEALAAAHARGLIHRDIKPGNIWLEDRGVQAAEGRGGEGEKGRKGEGEKGRKGEGERATEPLSPPLPLSPSPPLPPSPPLRVKILDFGLARAASQDAGLTQQGAIIGTPAYMAPEQARGAPIDARSDLFSLGVVLYRMCTGSPPFDGTDTVSTLMAVATTEPAAPVTINAKLPRDLSDLVMKLLEKDPDKRIASAGAVVVALQTLEKQLATEKPAGRKAEAKTAQATARRPGGTGDKKTTNDATTQLLAPLRRSRAALAVAALCGALVLIVGAAVFFWQTNHGTVKVTINDPNIKVTFDDKELVFHGDGSKEFTGISVGKHGLHVQRDGLQCVTTEPIIVKRGDTVVLEIVLLKGTLKVMQGDKVLGASQEPPPLAVAPLPIGDTAPKTAGKNSDVKIPAPVSPPRGDFALYFAGSNTGALMPVNLDITRPFTIEAHMTEPQRPSLVWRPIYSKSVALVCGKEWGFLLALQKGVEMLTAPLKIKQKTHVACVFSGKEMLLFIDGKLAKSKDVQTNLPVKHVANLHLGIRFRAIIHGMHVSQTARYAKDFTPARRFAPDKDSLALYHCDEGTGTVLNDSSGNNRHVTLISAKWVKNDAVVDLPDTDMADPPGPDCALYFNGADHIEIPGLKLPAKGPYTMEGYFRAIKGHFNSCVLGIRDQTMLRCNNQDVWRLEVLDTGKTKGKLVQSAPRGKDRDHLAAVHDGKETRLYVNGKLFNRRASQEAAASKLPFTIGENYKGTVDEVRVSKSARYKADFAPATRFEPDADTLALYHFDEGAGNEIIDSSGNGYDAAFDGATWVKADGSPIGAPPSKDGKWR